MIAHSLLAVASLCAAVDSPRELADAYRLRAALNWMVADEYLSLADTYDPFSNEVAVLEEFAASQATLDGVPVSERLDARSLWLRGEALRLAVQSDSLLVAAEEVPSRYRGFHRFRVRAMRRECLAALQPST